MPLLHDGSDESRDQNIATLRREGKEEKQAVAIAYSIQRRARGEADPEEVTKGISMATGEFAEEHKRLLRVLRSTSHKDDKQEARRQEKEVREEMPEHAEEIIGKADRGPHEMLTGHEVRQRAHEKEPSEAQRRAGNYPKTHWRMHGMEIAIENLAGTKRCGVDPSGKPWEVVMPYHYGYIKGTEGADGDHLDVAVGPLMDRGTEAHIINQRGPSGEFDEHKVFIGYPSRESAIHDFRKGRSDNPDDVLGSVVTVPIGELKRWIKEGSQQDPAALR